MDVPAAVERLQSQLLAGLLEAGRGEGTPFAFGAGAMVHPPDRQPSRRRARPWCGALLALLLLPVVGSAADSTVPGAAGSSLASPGASGLAAVAPSVDALAPAPVDPGLAEAFSGDGGSDLFAQPTTAVPAPPPLKASGTGGHWGFTTLLGTGGAGGDFGNLFRNPVIWNYQFFRQYSVWRVGLGLSFDSFKMKADPNQPAGTPPYQDEPEWGYQEISLFGTRLFNTKGTIRPYVQVHAGTARIRPRSEYFVMNPLPPDFESGQQRMKASDGFQVGVVPGLEFRLGRAAFLDASLDLTYFHVSEYDLSPVGQPPRSSGTSWVGRFGVTWLPNGEQTGPGAEPGKRDAWGVQRSFGWAAGEVLAINNLSGVAAQYIRNVDWSETNPRSWWDNIKTGFKYDPDTFKTNQWTHPFNGAAYYNSARSNGVNYWGSTGFALVGAFEWEMAGETQRMSLNDMFATTIGGIALGESMYRLSSEILDNQSTGMGRVWREIGGFFTDPVREFNRLVRGEAKKVAPNPVDPIDWRPPGGTNFVAMGVHVLGEGSSITNNVETNATLLLNHHYGNVFDNDRRGAFDYVDFVAELNTNAKVALGNVQIRGDLASWPLGGGEKPDHVLSLVQHFDYVNNTAYEFGGQSLGAALNSRFRLSDSLGLTTRVDADGILMGGINAEYSRLAEVPNPERLREYDYGPGIGTQVRVDLSRSGRPLLGALYRFAWIKVTNGSIYVGDQAGSDANHRVQAAGLRLVVPVVGSFGVGADAYVFLRNSHYAVIDSVTGQRLDQYIKQRNPQVRVYLAFSNSRS